MRVWEKKLQTNLQELNFVSDGIHANLRWSSVLTKYLYSWADGSYSHCQEIFRSYKT
jgi:hypothetical protein